MRGSRKHRQFWGVAAVALFLLVAWQTYSWATGSAGHDSTSSRLEGGIEAKPGLTLFSDGQRVAAPVLRGKTLDDEVYSLRQDRGQVVVVNVWGSWCGPCRAETPDLVRLANQYRSRGVRFLGIDTRDNLAAARAFERTLHVPYPSLIDNGQVTLRLRHIIPSAVVPSTIVIDQAGNVAARIIGRVTYRTLRGLLYDETTGRP